MDFITVPIDKKSPFWAKVYSLYKSSFPAEERRTLSQLQSCFTNSNYRLEAFFQSDVFVGFVEYWLFDTFLYIEHLSVAEEKRGKSIGTSIMKKIVQMNFPIFLEIELLIDDVAKRRFDFYSRLNFEKIDIPYFQPSYGKGKKILEMHLLSYRCDDNLDIKKCIDQIHAVVYHQYNA